MVGVSAITFAPVDAGSAPSPLLTITVKVGAPFAKDGDEGPISEPGSGSAAGMRRTLSVIVPSPSQYCGKVVTARRSASAIGAFLLQRDRLAESPRPSERDADDPADADVDPDRDLRRQIGLLRCRRRRSLDRDHDGRGEGQRCAGNAAENIHLSISGQRRRDLYLAGLDVQAQADDD